MQGFYILVNQTSRPTVALLHQTAHLSVDFLGCLLAIITMLGNLTAKEDLLFLFAKTQGTELFAHAPFADHLARQIGGLLNILSRTVGLLFKNQLLGDASTHEPTDDI